MSKFVIFKLPVGGLIIPQAFCNCPEYLNDNGTVKSDYWNFAIAAHKQIKFLQKCLETNDKDILVEERSKTQDTVMLELLDILRLRRLHEIMDKAATLLRLKEGTFTFKCENELCSEHPVKGGNCSHYNLEKRKLVVAEATTCAMV